MSYSVRAAPILYFCLTVPQDQLSSEQQQEYREVWDHFDVGKTGSLAPKEYAVLMRAVGEDVSEQQASSMGASISFNEFLANRQAKWFVRFVCM